MCFKAAIKMVNEGQTVRLQDDKYERVMVARGEANAAGHITADPANAQIAVNYIDKLLDRNLRALIGISAGGRTPTEIPEDRVTGHYVVVYGRGYEPDGRVYYQFKDPGTHGRGDYKEFIDGKLYIDDQTGILFKYGDAPDAPSVLGHDYEVSQVRVYAKVPVD